VSLCLNLQFQFSVQAHNFKTSIEKNVTLLSQNTAQWTENRGKYSKEQNAKTL
jgi:hypothetical protein